MMTIGLFQLETKNSKKLMFNFKPNKFSDLIIFLGLIRPGSINITKNIINSKKKRKIIKIFDSDELNIIISETYGNIIFEEQVIRILSNVCECDLALAELKRREIKE